MLAFAASACSGDSGPLRIPLGSGGDGRNEASADAMSLSMLTPSTFVLADGVDIPAGEAEAWRWDAPGVEDVAALADRLGVEGTPVEVPADQGGGWTVGDPSAVNASSLSVAAGGAWSAAAGGSQTVVSSAECVGPVVMSVDPASPEGGPVVTTVDDQSACVDVEATPEPPADLPTDEEILATATAIFGDAAEARVDWRDDWSVAVSADYLVDGQRSGHAGYYAVYGTGWYASGLLGEPVAQGRYPTIYAAEAVARLTDSQLGTGFVTATGGLAISSRLPGDEPAVQPMPESKPAESPPSDVPTNELLSVEPQPAEIDPVAPIEPMPIEPMPEPEPVEVVLVSVTATLVPFFDGTSAAWSLPGYLYIDADGGEWGVVAVSDDYFEEPTEVPPGAVPPGDGGAVPGDEKPTVDVGSGGGVADPSTGSGGSGASEPGYAGTLPDVVGQTEDDATVALEAAGFTVRVVERDGEMFMVTKDYREDRVNLVVTRGVVTSLTIG
ncbi:MAG: PASTA domain-containing protein [Acidimicrobiia bacterium]